MLKNISREQLIGAWVAAVILMMAGSIAAGSGITIGNAMLWLVAAAVPPGVTLMLWHDALPVTVNQLLYAADDENDARP